MSISNILKSNGVNQWDLECDALTITNTINATGASSGSLQVLGGASVSGDLFVSGHINGGGSFDPTGQTTFTNTTVSTSPSSGALVVNGGVGIVGDTNIGGKLNVNSTTVSTSTSTGSMVVNGGVGVGSDVNVGRNVYVNGMLWVKSTSNATDFSTGSVVVEGGVAIKKDVYADNLFLTGLNGSIVANGDFGLGGDGNVDGLLTANTSKVLGTGDTGSTSTGALVVAGGVGIGKRLYVAGDTIISGTVSASNFTSCTDTGTCAGAFTAGTFNVKFAKCNNIVNMTWEGLVESTTANDTLNITLSQGIPSAYRNANINGGGQYACVPTVNNSTVVSGFVKISSSAPHVTFYNGSFDKFTNSGNTGMYSSSISWSTV